MTRFNLGVLLALLLASSASAAQPVVSNVRAAQRSGTKLVDIYYDVSDADGHAQTVQVYVSGDNGLTFRIPAVTFTGAVGANVTPGVNKHIVWDAGRDWNGQFVESTKVRIVCNDGTTPVPPFHMVYIPAGPFQMGDNLMEIGDDARPVRTVNVDGFFMDKFEVSRDLWNDVRNWALANGYSYLNVGGARAAGHPIQAVNWFDATVWCNARSEREGLTPVYYLDAGQTTVLRIANGQTIPNSYVKWDANGYRLPTEAEWEKAARGARLGNRYPWGDTHTGGEQANYASSSDPYDQTTPCGYYNGSQSPAGPDMANGYGLYDMAGNVWEWCWDWYSPTFYGIPNSLDNPHGPDMQSSSPRVRRGGSWNQHYSIMACAMRLSGLPGEVSSDIGFRCARGR